jgi:hypothetical protein
VAALTVKKTTRASQCRLSNVVQVVLVGLEAKVSRPRFAATSGGPSSPPHHEPFTYSPFYCFNRLRQARTGGSFLHNRYTASLGLTIGNGSLEPDASSPGHQDIQRYHTNNNVCSSDMN